MVNANWWYNGRMDVTTKNQQRSIDDARKIGKNVYIWKKSSDWGQHLKKNNIYLETW